MTDGTRLDYELAETTLDNGLRVCVQPDPVAPAVAIAVAEAAFLTRYRADGRTTSLPSSS